MGPAGESFDLHTTMNAIGQAALAVSGHMLFKFALHGLIMAALLALCGLAISGKNPLLQKTLITVARRISVFCLVISLPGVIYLTIYHHLPDAGVFNINSVGFICLWSLICLHLSAEEIYHRQSKSKA